MNILEKTGITFETGKTLTARELNILNNTINSIVDAVNTILHGYCDVNQEGEDPDTVYTLQEALNLISGTRRAIGMKIRFKSTEGFVEYSFIGDSVDDLTWLNLDNWVQGASIIDGGTF